MKKIRILLADDHALVRSGIAALLQMHDEFEVVGEAGDGLEAIEKTTQLSPDIVLIDISMPGISGIEATKVIRKKCPDTAILVLTMHDSEEYIYQIFKAGADGYILKSARKEEVLTAVRTVAEGGKYFSQKIADVLLKGYVRKGFSKKSDSAADELPLTARELEVLALIGDGLSTQQIAERLFISPRTVDTHRTNVMQKLDIHSSAQLVRFAIDRGLTSVKPQKPQS